MKPLYNHTSEETSFLINDYPYGRTVRCRIRYWVEFSPNKGFRFCSQTEHPTKLIWNKPKKGTYSLLGMCMYLDESNGHVEHKVVHEYSSYQEVQQFLADFPDLPSDQVKRIKDFAEKKARYLELRLNGKVVWTVNGEVKPDSEEEKVRIKEEMEGWQKVFSE